MERKLAMSFIAFLELTIHLLLFEFASITSGSQGSNLAPSQTCHVQSRKRGLSAGITGSIGQSTGRAGIGSSRTAEPKSLIGGIRQLLDDGTSLLSGSGLHNLLEGIEFYDASAPPDGPLPFQIPGDAPWTQSVSSYRKKITCPVGTGAPRGVILLVPGTACKSGDIWPKTLYPQGLMNQGYSYCWVDLPNNSLGDFQLSAEFVAYAIRYLSELTGKIGILTYSQGGANVQWALTFWPSLKERVWGFVAVAPPMRGTVLPAVCTALFAIGGCLPSVLQVNLNSNYMRALNAGTDSGSGAYAQVPTTTIYSAFDEFVAPNFGPNAVSKLSGASNVLLQSVCGAAHVVEHFFMLADPGVYAIAMDALINQRPAIPSNVDASFCNKVDKYLGSVASMLALELKIAYRIIMGNTGQRIGMLFHTLATLQVPAEPLLQMYVCQRGYANQCTPNGFRERDPSKFILGGLPIIRHINGLLTR